MGGIKVGILVGWNGISWIVSCTNKFLSQRYAPDGINFPCCVLHWCIYILSEDGRTLIPANGMSAAAAALNKR